MSTFASHTLADGNTLLVVATSSSGGGKWGQPGYINLVEIAAGQKFDTVRSKSTVAVHRRVLVECRHTGPKSHYGRTVARLTAEAARMAQPETAQAA